ncbi:MAG: hypothetical protein LM588_02855 [Fervidicoccaceae archaeon]|nr:hypothetical protein [Fervidicoccaceae archaeon]
MNNKNTLILVAGLMAMVFVAASVFAYYPLSITVSPTTPPVTFATGSNSNQNDLGPGNTITVSLGSNSASASVTVHPTYQKTYYKDVLRITNSDSKTYNVYIRVDTAIASFPAGSTILLKIYDSGTPIATVPLTSTGTVSIGSLSGGGAWEVDVEVYIPEGSSLPSSATANLQLIYTPSSETPP